MKNKNGKKPAQQEVTNVLNPEGTSGGPVQIHSKHPKKPKKQYL